jgi:hypothetical protein
MNKQEEYIKLLEEFSATEKEYIHLVNEVLSVSWEGDKRNDSPKPLTKERLKKIREARRKMDEAEARWNAFRIKDSN